MDAIPLTKEQFVRYLNTRPFDWDDQKKNMKQYLVENFGSEAKKPSKVLDFTVNLDLKDENGRFLFNRVGTIEFPKIMAEVFDETLWWEPDCEYYNSGIFKCRLTPKTHPKPTQTRYQEECAEKERLEQEELVRRQKENERLRELTRLIAAEARIAREYSHRPGLYSYQGLDYDESWQEGIRRVKSIYGLDNC